MISNLSVFDLSFFNSLAQNFFCFKKASTLCSGTDIKAVSDPEKNADNRNMFNTQHPEYIVYDTSQIKIRYIVQVERNGYYPF